MADRRVVFLVGLSLLSSASHGHLLKVFAFADGDRIEGSVYFAGGAGAPGARVSILAPDGRVLTRTRPEADGAFTFTATEHVDHLVVANTGEGHKATWTVRADELSGGLPAAAERRVAPAAPASRGTVANCEPAASKPGTGELEALVDRAVARQVRPLREALLAYEDRIRLHDILGGVGYIAGLAGLALWWRSRRTTGKP